MSYSEVYCAGEGRGDRRSLGSRGLEGVRGKLQKERCKEKKKKKIKLVFSPNKGTPWSSTGTVPGSRAGQEAGAGAQELTTW